MNRFLKILPWLLIIVAIGAACLFYSSNKSKDEELAKLRPQAEEVSQLKRENAELQKLPNQSDEVARLKKENADLLKLRNEARRARDEKKQTTSYLQTVQAKAQQAEAQVQAQATRAAQQQQAQLQISGQNLIAGGQRQDARASQRNACINCLRQIDGAKQQWALENKKTEQAVPTANDIAPYLKDSIVPKCPAGGVYSINSVAVDPTCSIPGHQLPK